MSLDLNNALGTHSFFYYYGQEHLMTNLLAFVEAGIDNHEMIYFSMESSMFKEFEKWLQMNEISQEHVEFQSVKDLILYHKSGGMEGLSGKLNHYILKALASGYQGIRWIEQPLFAVEETSMADYLKWEQDLSRVLQGTNASMLCIYDYLDFFQHPNFFNKELLSRSLDTHSHRLYKFTLK